MSAEQVGPIGWGHTPVRFVAIQSLAGTECKFELPHWKPEELVVEEVDRGSGAVIRQLDSVSIKENIAAFPTQAGSTYLLYPSGAKPDKVWAADWKRPVTPNLHYVGLPERSGSHR